MDSIVSPLQESVLATAPPFGQITVTDEPKGRDGRGARKVSGAALRPGVCCCCCSILPSTASRRLSMPLSPCARSPPVPRAGFLASASASCVMFVICLIFAAQRRQAVRRLSMQMKLVTSFPILALLLFPVSQQATRTISSARLASGRHSTHVLHHVPLRVR